MGSGFNSVLLTFLLTSMLTACAQVGSERWCQNMQETPKTEWTINEGSDYTRYCLFKFR